MSIVEVNKTDHTLTISEPSKSISKTYEFDGIFDSNVGQKQFVDSLCDPLIQFLRTDGNTGLIFSYGITNSGKTYSILGTPENPGILLNLIHKLTNEFKEESIKIVACQLYKDSFFSLKNKGEKINPKEVRGTISFDDCEF